VIKKNLQLQPDRAEPEPEVESEQATRNIDQVDRDRSQLKNSLTPNNPSSGSAVSLTDVHRTRAVYQADQDRYQLLNALALIPPKSGNTVSLTDVHRARNAYQADRDSYLSYQERWSREQRDRK
jgi:hypothetical protein